MFYKHKNKFLLSFVILLGTLLCYTLFTFTEQILDNNKNIDTSLNAQGTQILAKEPIPLGAVHPTVPSPIPVKLVSKPLNNVPQSIIKQNCLVLGYHSINDKLIYPEHPSLYVYPSEFEKQLKFLKENNYTPINFDQLDSLTGIEKPVIITFDDGYEDNFTNAYPILKKYNFKATIFMPTTFINTKDYLTMDQIKQMSDIVSFQSHTVTHRRLSSLSPEEIEKELSESQEIMSKLTGKPVDAIAYPCCDYNDKVAEIAKKYYKYVNTTYTGLYKVGSNKQNITRIYIGRIHKLDTFKKRILGLQL